MLPELMKKYDVVIIGAGPAGSTAAKIIASAGLDVAVFEKKKTIGKSQCAGYVSLTINLDSLPDEVVQSYITGMRTYLPGGGCYNFPLRGAVVDRSGFDRLIAGEARDCGAKYMLNLPITGLIQGDGCFKGITVTSGNGNASKADAVEVKAKLIIGADGVFSRTAYFLGLKQQPAAHCAQYLIDGVKPLAGTAEIFFDTNYAPGGYVWIYPAGAESVKMGLGIVRSVVRSLLKMTPSAYLDRFISGNPFIGERLRAGRIREKTKGVLPVGGLREKVCIGNVLLAGDSAGTADPVTGAGINNALLAGELAGSVAVQSINNDDPAVLQSYEIKLKKLLGKSLGRSLDKRKKMDILYSSNAILENGLPGVWPGFAPNPGTSNKLPMPSL